jgi:hypothetical protein
LIAIDLAAPSPHGLKSSRPEERSSGRFSFGRPADSKAGLRLLIDFATVWTAGPDGAASPSMGEGVTSVGLMSQAKFEIIDGLPHAKTNLLGFGGAALVVTPTGDVQGANDMGVELLGNLDEDTLHEIAIAGARAIAADAMRLERLNGPFPGDCADAVIQPLVGRGHGSAGALVLIATNPA